MTVAVAAVLAMAAAPARGDIHGGGWLTFVGSCGFSGSATFTPVLTAAPGTRTYSFASRDDFTSTCTGELRDFAPGTSGRGVLLGSKTWQVAVTATNTGTMSCAGGYLPGENRSGNAALQFLHDDRTPLLVSRTTGDKPAIMRLGLTTVAAGPQVALLVDGGRPPRYANGSRARGTASFAPDAASAEACLLPGLTRLDFSAEVATGPTRRANGNRAIDNVLVSLNRIL